MRGDVHKDDAYAEPAGFGASADNESESERPTDATEAVSQGRDVHDTTRHGVSHGRDVVSDDDTSEIESHGRTVIDRSRFAEARGTDVIDRGPHRPSADEQRDH